MLWAILSPTAILLSRATYLVKRQHDDGKFLYRKQRVLRYDSEGNKPRGRKLIEIVIIFSFLPCILKEISRYWERVVIEHYHFPLSRCDTTIAFLTIVIAKVGAKTRRSFACGAFVITSPGITGSWRLGEKVKLGPNSHYWAIRPLSGDIATETL